MNLENGVAKIALTRQYQQTIKYYPLSAKCESISVKSPNKLQKTYSRDGVQLISFQKYTFQHHKKQFGLIFLLKPM